ncbi:MAG TPA: hypothetical protein VIF61_09630 [Methylocystis sp.]|jgi:hypothetical protein
MAISVDISPGIMAQGVMRPGILAGAISPRVTSKGMGSATLEATMRL